MESPTRRDETASPSCRENWSLWSKSSQSAADTRMLMNVYRLKMTNPWSGASLVMKNVLPSGLWTGFGAVGVVRMGIVEMAV